MGQAEHAKLRALLPRTFDAFFDRFGSLLDVQRRSIEPLLDGRDVLLAAPTAGGKTEAAVAPLLQRVLDAEGTGTEAPALLYVVPTRALVNDVFRRLEQPLARLGLSLGRRTADHRVAAENLPQVLVTTPESFDSLLARAPRRFLPVQVLILDELHAIHGGPRGDQCAALRVRLARVLSTRGAKLQTAMLSATLEDPLACARRFAEDPIVVRDPGKRRMRAKLARTFSGESLGPALGALVERKAGKVLVFANARADVERAAAELRGKLPFGSRVYAHHGSLSRDVRERTERDFAQAKTAVCFATSTLELGIDIGDVDHAVLYGVPPDLPSYLQRVGRAGRRKGEVSILVLARDEGEVLRFRHMVAAASEGELLTDAPVYDPGTAVQQASSLCFQNPARAVAPAHVLERLPAWQSAWWSEERLEGALAVSPWLDRVGPGHFVPTERLEDAFRRGSIHGNITGEVEVEVLEELTGRTLGSVRDPDAEGAADGDDAPYLLGGASRRLRRREDGRLVAEHAAPGRGEARFDPRPAPPVPARLAADLCAALGFAPRSLGRVETEDRTIFLHGLGTLAGTVLHFSAGDRARKRPGRGLAFGLTLRHGHADWPSEIVQARRLELVCRDQKVKLARLLGFGPYFRELPAEERERAILDAVDPDALARWLVEASLVEIHADEQRERVRALCAP